jgi:hypothetical protein
MPESLPVIDYNPHRLPPRRMWKVSVNIPRNTAGTLCERLYLLVGEKCGASIFIPDIAHARNTCRFEWNREWNGDPFGLRVGLTFVVGDGPITEVELYVTTRDLINAESGTPPPSEPALLNAVNEEVGEMFRYAQTGETAEQPKDWVVVLHISVPYQLGFAHTAEAADGRFRFLRTRIVPKDWGRLSALLVRCRVRSAEAARQEASSVAMTVLALLALTERRKYELTALRWPRSRAFNNVLPASRAIKEDRLFPPHRYLTELEEVDPAVISRFEEVWSAFGRLQESDRTVFVPALLANYAATNSSVNFATISTVGYMAALGALSGPVRRKCPGILTCSKHGALGWQHDEVSETGAIIETILKSCGIDRADHRLEIGDLVKRVYREQRSAFVHSARLRHAEYSQGAQVPAAIPSNDAPTSEFFVHQDDLMSIGGVTRRTLLEWLFSKSGTQLDRARMKINTDRVTYRSLYTAAATASPKTITRISTGGVAGAESANPVESNIDPASH